MGALKRPTIVAWAVNQLARRDRETVEALIDTQRSLAGVPDKDQLHELVRRRRELIARLTEEAVRALTEAGHPATGQTRERVSTTLLSTAGKEEQDLVLAGRLERELTAGGLEGAFPDIVPDGPEPSPTPRAERALHEAQVLETKAWEAREKAESLAKEAALLRREADSAESEAASASREADRLEKKARAARARTER